MNHMFDKGIGKDNIAVGATIGIMDKINWKPKWKIEKYHGKVCPENLYDIDEFDGNLLLNEGIAELLALLIGGTATPFSNANAYIGVGDGTTAASASQTGLSGSNKTYAGMDSTYPQVSAQTITFRSTFGSSVGNHAWREFTVANSNSDSGKNLNRKVEAPLRTKVSPDTWIIQLAITIS